MRRFSNLVVTIIIIYNFCISQNNTNDSLEKTKNKTYTKKQVFTQYITNSLPAYLFFGPYSYLYGVNLGGQSIVKGEKPSVANTKWLATPVIAGFLIRLATKDIIKEVLKKEITNDNSSTFYYNIYYTAPDISSIKDIEFVSIEGSSKFFNGWDANIAEVTSSYDFPAFGYRSGFTTVKYGLDYEMSISEHHTQQQDVFFQYNSNLGGVQDNVRLPSHFYMLHHMFMGINAYYVLPEVILTPYIGIGGGVLLNSVQSEYPGPADLVRQEGSLALDAMDMNIGYHGFFGLRYMRDYSFYYLEFRPTLHSFDIESGSQGNRSNDTFKLQSFQIQLGIGKSIFNK